MQEEPTRTGATDARDGHTERSVPLGDTESIRDRAALGEARDVFSDHLDREDARAEDMELARSAYERRRHAGHRQLAAEDREAAVVALAAADAEIASLRRALERRAVIGQALGIIMATQHIDAEEAFTRLVSMSQSAHVKIRDLAPRVVEQSLRSWTRDGA